MVNLGFLSSSEQCPDHVRHVRVLPGAETQNRPGLADVEISKGAGGTVRWTLRWHVLDPKDTPAWGSLMASQMVNLGWDAWWLDVDVLHRTMGLDVDHALIRWGEPFWRGYREDALVYLDVGGWRRQVYQAVRHWEAQTSHVRFSTRHDLDISSRS